MLAYKRRIEIGLQCMCECMCVYTPHVEGKIMYKVNKTLVYLTIKN